MFKVRSFIEKDYDSLREIYFKSRAINFTWLDKSNLKIEDFDRDTKDESILVAARQDQILGFISMWVPDRFVHHLFVHPDFVGQQVGKELLQAATDKWGTPMTLKCMRDNAKALNFYASQGWQVKEEGVSPDGPYYLMERR
ncbi:GNAT family N-acetyltransferase [Cohnella silvisoli]|uniref:GNAT family N-acetyltransferase n=1 Tax=Cohnella silvisoli TaxID=2873699 RepID=A0ABV1KP76_9BACL|nr:GNAT family N-acetyltransferase [Cohnella silvisoli]MCD9020413.1 GNAT family N-acetyltransferase [Cohnella silvisoli]